MSSPYAQKPLGGKAASLTANEHVPTPAPKRTPSKGPSLEPIKKAAPGKSGLALRGPQPSLLTSGKSDNFVTGMKKSPPKRTAAAPALQTLLGGPAEKGTPKAHTADLQRSQKALAKVYRQNHPIGQQVIEGIANTVPGVALAKGLSKGHVDLKTLGNEAFNDLSSGLVPVGKGAAILGGLRGLKKATETATVVEKAGRLSKIEQKALQVVREGTPIEKRISDASAHMASLEPGSKEAASAKEEIRMLRAARRHVVDVHGMPRIDPHNPRLIDIYEKQLKQEPKDAVQGMLRGAKVARGKQDAGYSAERAARFAKAHVHLSDSNLSPEERIGLAKNELRGELPKINFGGYHELNAESLPHLQATILDHPLLSDGQKIRAASALSGVLEGRTPQPNEIKLLEHVFGRETANGIGSAATHPMRQLLLGAINVPRSLMASFDFSAPFRQGLVVATSHPLIFGKNFKPMMKAFGNDNVYHGILSDIRDRPSYPMMMEAKLSFTELGKQAAQREEQFPSDLAEHIPIAGRGVKASGRAYTAYLDKTRADVFDHLIQRAQEQGINVHDDKFLHDLGRYINSATGRGPLGPHLQGAATALNAFFFSPRLLASRLDLIFSPVTYAKADPFVRREALRSMIQLAGTASTLLALASQIPGVKVVTDPRNPDWGKIRHGNTRIDIGGGFQQPLRLFAQLATGTAISSTTGKKLNLTANGFGQPTRLDLLLRFFEGKESPIASLATDKLRNSSQIGQKFAWKTEIQQRLIPLLAQDSYDLYKEKHGGMNGLAAAFAGYGVGSVGFGLQTYGPPATKTRAPSASYDPYTSESSVGGSDYAQSGASSGSDYAQSP